MPTGEAIKATYDARTDTLNIVKPGASVVERDDDKPGLILDCDAAGNLGVAGNPRPSKWAGDTRPI